MRSKFVAIIIFSLWLPRFFQPAEAQDEKFKAIFIYNFTKYINWPVYQGNFVISILGNGSIFNEIEEIATKKKVGASTIFIQKINSITEISTCHILYIASAKADFLAEALLLAKSRNILLITEKKDACKNGSGINFINREGKLSFEISKPNIEACGLSVSSDLLKLGTGNVK